MKPVETPSGWWARRESGAAKVGVDMVFNLAACEDDASFIRELIVDRVPNPRTAIRSHF